MFIFLVFVFNMSDLCAVGDVFWDPEFPALGNSFLWVLGALEEQYRECIGFPNMPKRPYEWRVDSHGCCKFDNAALGFGPRDQSAHFPVFLHLRTTNLPGPDFQLAFSEPLSTGPVAGPPLARLSPAGLLWLRSS